MAPVSRQRLIIEAAALAAAVSGSTALLVASCLGDTPRRSETPDEPPFVERVASPEAPPAAPPPAPPTVNVTVNTPPAAPAQVTVDEDASGTATITAADAGRGGINWVMPIVRVADAGGGAAAAEPAPTEPPPAPAQLPDAGTAPDGGPADGAAPAAPPPPPMGAGSFMTTPPYNRASNLPTSPDPEAGAGPFLLDRSTRWPTD